MSEATRDFRVREAALADVSEIARLFRGSYGGSYLYPQFVDPEALARLVYDPSVVTLVAEDPDGCRLVGTASILLVVGAYTDLVGEFGRLVVDPQRRGQGIGGMLMEERLKRVGDRLHVGFTEVRTSHPFSTQISQKYGFVPMGFLPHKLRFGDRREHAGLLVRHFGEALRLRRNHPRVIPEADHLANNALKRCGLDAGHILDESTPPYPPGSDVELEELTAEGYSDLLRIERGRVVSREVFGPLRLHYGLFKLRATSSTYIVARRESRIVGAIGFTLDEMENNVRVFELIQIDDDVTRPLFKALARRARDDLGMVTVEVDVSAHAPRLQRTLVELGYLPAAYIPALAFHDVERLDVVKMYHLLRPVPPVSMDQPYPTRELAERVLRAFEGERLQPQIANAIGDLTLSEGLSTEQRNRLARAFGHRTLEEGDVIFEADDPAEVMYVLLRGAVHIRSTGGVSVGTVGPGEALGEVALLSDSPHSHTAVASDALSLATLTREALETLVRQRPDIGLHLYRNLADGLGDKLRRADEVIG